MLQSFFSNIWFYLGAILFFGFIIALHEFGHFSTAKMFGIRVKEYSIGMGPAILKKTKNETKYSLRLFPIGGFVALEGEDEESDDPRAFGNQKAWKRFIVIAAGAVLNVILGFLLMGIMLGIDGKVANTVVTDATTSMQQAENGVRIGDKIQKIDGITVYSARDLYYCLYRSNDDKIDIVLKRDGEKINLTDVKVDYSLEEAYCSFIVGTDKINALNIIPGMVRETASMSKMVFLSLVDLLRGQYGMKDLSGPIGTIEIVADTAGDAVAAKDYSSIIFILAFITVNIGLMNLLPLPALDGGRLFFIFIEIIFRKPVPKKFEAIVHTVGLVLLLILMAVISFNDIYNIFKR